MLSRRATVCLFVVMKMGILSHRVNSTRPCMSLQNYSEWRTLEGDCVEPVKQGSINDAKEFIKRYRDVDFIYTVTVDFYINISQRSIHKMNSNSTAVPSAYLTSILRPLPRMDLGYRDCRSGNLHQYQQPRSHCCVRGTRIR